MLDFYVFSCIGEDCIRLGMIISLDGFAELLIGMSFLLETALPVYDRSIYDEWPHCGHDPWARSSWRTAKRWYKQACGPSALSCGSQTEPRRG